MKKLPKLSSVNILYLSIFSFLFVATTSLSLTARTNERVITIKTPIFIEEKEFPALPVLIGNNLKPEFSAGSVFAQDLESGVVLFEKNADQKLFPASTTKMLTAITAMEYYKPEDVVKVTGIKVAGQKMNLVEGEEIKVSDLISGLLIYSANDAAEALASNYCSVGLPKVCGREVFIEAMNLKAKEFNLNNSNFANPTGLDSLGHYSTSRDMVRIAIELMKNPELKTAVSTKEETVSSLDGKFVHKLVNLNELVGEVEGVLGVKTGWTEAAKENLVTYIERGDRKVVIAILGSDDRFGETKKLIDYIFDNYEWKEINI